MRLSIRVRKTPGRTIVFHHFWCCEFVQSLGFSAFVGASHRSLARAGDRWLVQTNGRTAFVGGAGESDPPTQMPDGPQKHPVPRPVPRPVPPPRPPAIVPPHHRCPRLACALLTNCRN